MRVYDTVGESDEYGVQSTVCVCVGGGGGGGGVQSNGRVGGECSLMVAGWGVSAV